MSRASQEEAVLVSISYFHRRRFIHRCVDSVLEIYLAARVNRLQEPLGLARARVAGATRQRDGGRRWSCAEPVGCSVRAATWPRDGGVERLEPTKMSKSCLPFTVLPGCGDSRAVLCRFGDSRRRPPKSQELQR